MQNLDNDTLQALLNLQHAGSGE